MGPNLSYLGKLFFRVDNISTQSTTTATKCSPQTDKSDIVIGEAFYPDIQERLQTATTTCLPKTDKSIIIFRELFSPDNDIRPQSTTTTTYSPKADESIIIFRKLFFPDDDIRFKIGFPSNLVRIRRRTPTIEVGRRVTFRPHVISGRWREK